MSKVKIISDSTCDLSEELLIQYDIAVLPHPIVRDGELLQDNVSITPDDIYKWSDENKTTPKTAAPSIEDAINAIKPYKEAGDDVIMFAISEDMSTTANVMRLAAKELYYEEHVFVINSESLSTGIGHLVVEAAILARKKYQPEEIVETIET